MSCRKCCRFFVKQKTAYEMRISDWSSDVCSSDLGRGLLDDAARLASTFLRRKQVAVVADASAWACHGPRLKRSLDDAGFTLVLYEVPPGEASKSRSEERRVGTECVSTCRSRWSPYH